MQQEGADGGYTKVERKRNKEVENRTSESDNREKIIYCQDFNARKCKFRDHHEGRFAGKIVTKFHICRKCHQIGENKVTQGRRRHLPEEGDMTRRRYKRKGNRSSKTRKDQQQSTINSLRRRFQHQRFPRNREYD